MAKPSELPEWEPTEPTDIVAPDPSKKLLGWQPGERPPAQNFNWFWRLISRWTDYLDSGQFEGNHSIAGNLVVTNDTRTNRDLRADRDLRVDRHVHNDISYKVNLPAYHGPAASAGIPPIISDVDFFYQPVPCFFHALDNPRALAVKVYMRGTNSEFQVDATMSLKGINQTGASIHTVATRTTTIIANSTFDEYALTLNADPLLQVIDPNRAYFIEIAFGANQEYRGCAIEWVPGWPRPV